MGISPIVPQAVTTSQTVLVASGAYTASDTYGPFPVDFFGSAEISTVVTIASGSLQVFIQKLLPDGVLFDDYWSSISFVTTGAVTINLINSGNFQNTQTSGGLTAQTSTSGGFGSYWRIRTVIGGGPNPTFNFGVFGNFRLVK